MLTNYFTDHEPASCFVAVYTDKVIGYILGTLDVEKKKRILWRKIISALLIKALRKKLFLNRGNFKFFLRISRSFVKGEFFIPKFSDQYPATLHVNIYKEFRGRKVGARLVEHYMKFLSSKGCKGVHLGTMSESAKNFFISQGFSILYKNVRSYLKPYTGKSYPYYILGKKIKNNGED